MDPDVKLAQEKWDAGEWTCWDVCRSIALQWGDQHVNDADGDGSNYNAHSAADIAVFAKAALACSKEVMQWLVLASGLVPK